MEESGYFLAKSSEEGIVTITYVEAERAVQASSKDIPRFMISGHSHS